MRMKKRCVVRDIKTRNIAIFRSNMSLLNVETHLAANVVQNLRILFQGRAVHGPQDFDCASKEKTEGVVRQEVVTVLQRHETTQVVAQFRLIHCCQNNHVPKLPTSKY